MSQGAPRVKNGRRPVWGTRLFVKLVLIIVPCFLIASSIGLFTLAEIELQNGRDTLATRIGNSSARVASALERLGMSYVDDTIWQEEFPRELVSVLLADQAIRCVELKRDGTDETSLSVPLGLGCTGQVFDQSLDLPVFVDADYTLEVHYSTEELDVAQRSRRDFSLLTLFAGLLITVLSSWLGFALIVGRPLGQLLNAIRYSQETGEPARIKSDRRDELGMVFEAFDGLQAHLADHREHLEELVEERTQEIERQKTRIEDALKRERELNGLQRQFVAMVSHEFRTPLAIIDGNAQRLLRRAESIAPERLKKALGTMRISVNRLVDLMESVLSSARLESGQIEMKPGYVAIAGLVQDVSGSYAELHKDRQISLDLDGLPERITADEKLIRQVISNIISNAIKYSPGGGRIHVGGFVDDLGHAVVSVRDEGVGIPLAEQEKLFQRFFRASTSAGITGSGIGLHLASYLVQMHGGVIDFESIEGEGTTFFIRLPVAGPRPGGDIPAKASDQASREMVDVTA